MKTAVYERYGPSDVVEVKEVEKPTTKDAVKAAVNPNSDSTVFETNLKERHATLP